MVRHFCKYNVIQKSICLCCLNHFAKCVFRLFGPWIWKKINEILKSHAYHIYVACETVGLSSFRTIELSYYRSDPVELWNLHQDDIGKVYFAICYKGNSGQFYAKYARSPGTNIWEDMERSDNGQWRDMHCKLWRGYFTVKRVMYSTSKDSRSVNSEEGRVL